MVSGPQADLVSAHRAYARKYAHTEHGCVDVCRLGEHTKQTLHAIDMILLRYLFVERIWMRVRPGLLVNG